MAYFNPYQPMGYGSPYGYPVWLKTTDGAGYATATPYTVTPYQPAPVVDVNSLETRVKRLEEMLNGKPDDADAERRAKQAE